MGLSSSQARLLNLTARMHDIEYKAQNLEAQKLQMANESAHVYQEYEDALNKQKVQFKNIDPDGAASYKNASVQTLLDNGYKVKLLNGGVWYASTILNIGNSKKAYFGEVGSTIDSVTFKAKDALKDKAAGDIVIYDGVDVTNDDGQTILSKDDKVILAEKPGVNATQAKVYTYTQNEKQAKLDALDLSDNEVLNNLVEAGFIVFEKPTNQKDSDGNIIYNEVNIATDTSLQSVSDETELKKAEAKYEADMRKINQKDKKFDTDLAALESERNAIKTEVDTLKSVAKDNVDRTFKLFS